MSATQTTAADWRAQHQGLQAIRETLRELPGCIWSKAEGMGNKEDCWGVHAHYTVARLQVAGCNLFQRRRWLQVLCQVTPEGGVSYQLFGSDFPTLEPGWTGASFDGLIERIKTL